ncbi:hypothetical protein L6452_05529 [Arctium lappa]|uniref:Uncharacterized protein n=1 Tax=Arctium lappa TaxID=4217 RepID=A0ACB9EHC1_ARCLA|nr:hypothetical protein L6452_05529 [Arctium lappa]
MQIFSKVSVLTSTSIPLGGSSLYGGLKIEDKKQTKSDERDGAGGSLAVGAMVLAVDVAMILVGVVGSPRDKRIGWETGAEPIREGLWGSEVVVVDGGCFGGGGS